MPRILIAFAVLVCAAAAARLDAAEPQLAHMVFFTVTEDTEQNGEALIAACQEYLSGHDGTVYFSVGSRARDLEREVNDRDFDVALHLVFADKKAYDKYATHPRHLKFIEENKDRWSKVRVFDSYLSQPDHDSIPTAAKGFAGMLRGRVVGTQQGQLTVEVAEIAKVWSHSKAEAPKALVGKNVVVKAREGAEQIARFISAVKAGESLELDVANREGDTLTLLELTERQREQVKE
ncbi:Dabb family protein [Roseimaritima sediminicola]|uniref:Dabb family protein n=1 Tax=Roseimaritima sediminicola TaxID=2662066 RepID=UPI00129829ED|nr:Dabb family protein [Roseimaritima sediminicola]